jgi:hypothetical protein
MEKLRNNETIELKADDGNIAIITKIDNTYDISLFKENDNYDYFIEIDIDLDRVYDILREYGFIKRIH